MDYVVLSWLFNMVTIELQETVRVRSGIDCPNLSSMAPHKLSPRSTLCVFLGCSSNHKGFRWLDLSSNYVIVSRHVTFDEITFSFAEF